jgi:hypothetical protein
VAEQPVTLRWFFFEQKAGATVSPERTLEDSGVLAVIKERVAHLPGLEWKLVAKELHAKVDEALDINLAQVIASAWKKYRLLQQYRDPRKHPADETILVPLAEHTIESVHRPHVDVLVNETRVARVEFEIRLALALEGVVLTVLGGRIRAIGAGRCRAQGSLKCMGLTVVERQAGGFELPGAIDLGDGIEIPAPSDEPPAASPPAS